MGARAEAAVRQGRRLATLSPQALGLMDALACVRFLTQGQANRLTPPDAVAALRTLGAAGLVARLPYRASPEAALERVWCLTPLGDQAARARASHAAGEGGPADPSVRRAARHAPDGASLSFLFLAHHLALADLYVDLCQALGPDAFGWRAGDGARVAFRSIASPDGHGLVVPDAIVTPPGSAWSGDPLERGGCAIELDRATMGRAAIERKLLRYRERIADRGPFGPVLFVAEAVARRRHLGRWLAAARLEGDAVDRPRAVQRIRAYLASNQLPADAGEDRFARRDDG